MEPSHYVFKPLTKSKLGHKFVSTNRPISYSTVREYFKSSFKDIVPDIAVFSTHSLRSGGASAVPTQVWLTGCFKDMADGSLFQLRMVILTII